MLICFIKKILKYSDEQLKNLNDAEKFVVSLDLVLTEKFLAAGNSKSALEDTACEILTNQDIFKNTLEQLENLKSTVNGYSAVSQNDYHPLILAAHSGKVQYFRMANANQAAWEPEFLARIVDVAQNTTEWSVARYIRDEIVTICIMHGYNYLEIPKNSNLPEDYNWEARDNPKLEKISFSNLMFIALKYPRNDKLHSTRIPELEEFRRLVEEQIKIRNESNDEHSLLSPQNNDLEDSSSTHLIAADLTKTDAI